MRQAFSEKMAATRTRLRRVLWAYGVGWLVAVTLTALLLAGLADWAIHASVGMRLLFDALILGALGWALVRFLVAPLTVRLGDLEVAHRIERLYPELGEQVSSTVAFLAADDEDPLAGSRALRDHVIHATFARSQDLEFPEVVQPRAARKACAGAIVVAGVALALALVAPADAAIAVRRLLDPLAGPDWPKRTRLELAEIPARIAKGDPFQLTAHVTGKIPARVTVQYRFAGGEETPPEPLAWVDEDTCRGGFDPAIRPFEFRVAGGDAATEWLPVDVVPAPEITELELSLTYPAYTQLASEKYPEGRGHIQAVVGTVVKLSARANKPLVRAEIAWSKGTMSPAIVGADSQSVSARFTVTASDQYRILVTDGEGINNATRSPKEYRVDAVPDTAPEVTIEQPPGDIEVTAQAIVPLRGLAKDDFGVARLELLHRKEDSGAAASAPENQNAPAEPWSKDTLFSGPKRPKRLLQPHVWNLAPLGLRPGSVVRYRLAAADARDKPNPNVGQSRELRLRVVSKEDFARQIENEQQLLREEIERVLKMQENAAAQVADLAKQARVAGKLKVNDVEGLQTAELLQRRVQEKIADSEQSLKQQVENLLARLKQNGISDPETTKRLVMAGSELSRVAEEHLPTIARSLTQARKSAKEPDVAPKGAPPGADKQAPPAPDKPAESKSAPSTKTASPSSKEAKAAGDAKPKSGPTSPPTGPKPAQPPAESTSNQLDLAKEHQHQVVQSLAQILEQLDQWETVAQVANEAQELARRQAEVTDNVAKLKKETLGKKESELTPEQKAETAKASEGQARGREQLDRLLRKMNRLAEKSRTEDPLAGATLNEAMTQAEKNDLSGQMGEAARDIQQNRLADAAGRQGKIEQGLKELVQTLEARREKELARLVKLLRESEAQMQSLRAEQTRLQKQTKEAAKIADPAERAEQLRRLKQRQRELRGKAEELARRLSKLRAPTASGRSGRAASRMEQAGDRMQGNEGDQAGEQQEQALEELEQAQDELAQARREAENQLADEQFAKVIDALGQLRDRQAAVQNELTRLQAIREKRGNLSRGELLSLTALGDVEGNLAAETKNVMEKLAAAKVFRNVLARAAELMDEAAGKLRGRDPGPSTSTTVAAALHQLQLLLDSLKPEDKVAKGKPQQQGEGGGEGGGGGQDGIPNLAQVKLLKLLQLELNEASTRLAARLRESKGKNPELAKAAEELAQRQGQLADMLRDITTPTEEDAPKEDQP